MRKVNACMQMRETRDRFEYQGGGGPRNHDARGLAETGPETVYVRGILAFFGGDWDRVAGKSRDTQPCGPSDWRTLSAHALESVRPSKTMPSYQPFFW